MRTHLIQNHHHGKPSAAASRGRTDSSRAGTTAGKPAIRTALLYLIALLILAGLAEAIMLGEARGLGLRLPPLQLASFLACLSLVLGVFVAFTSTPFVRDVRERALGSPPLAFAMPFALVLPYLLLALTTGTFTWLGLGKLVGYIAVPVALLMPDRLRPRERASWRDFAAMLALGYPVAARWLTGIWVWPEELYFFRPLYSVCIGAYAFLVIRNLEGVGYRLVFRKGDAVDALSNWVAFAIIGIPLGLALHFIHPHRTDTLDWLTLAARFAWQFVGIYLTVAIPEEFLFRGVLQNLLVRSLPGVRRGLWGLLIASVVFGLSHLHHAPVPNWRYAILATVAGLFYGNAYRNRKRLPAPALTHSLVDTMWHFWF